jgi:hypothetical protein
MTGQGGVALAWGGKQGTPAAQTKTNVVPATCSPDVSTVDTNTYYVGLIYYVTSSNGVNVRQNPGTSYCIITTQANGADVVRVPGVNSVSANGYTWIKVAYYLGQSRFSTNYSWSNTGWIATTGLTLAQAGDGAHTFTCEISTGCDSYGWNNQTGWGPGGPYPPTNPEWTQSQCQSSNECAWVTYHNTEVEYTGLEWGASTDNPNWFVVNTGAYVFGWNLYWNYDWWAH